jgi:RNA polymerase sigma factor (sigma-70 family)
LSIDPAPHSKELLQRKERMVRTHAIPALSERQKQCLYLRAEGFRYRGIAELLGVTVSPVAELLHRAIKKLTSIPTDKVAESRSDSSAGKKKSDENPHLSG